jgi:hypothetical protein
MTTPAIAAIAARHAAGETLTFDEIAALVAIALVAPELPIAKAKANRDELIAVLCRRFLWNARSRRLQALAFLTMIERFERTAWRSTRSLLLNPYASDTTDSFCWAILKACPPSFMPRSAQAIVNILMKQEGLANP